MKRYVYQYESDGETYTYDVYAKNITSALNQIKKLLNSELEDYEIISIQEDC
nr:MAG TPA: protein of unknown function (DUF4494) [Caudoviricetes sp.]